MFVEIITNPIVLASFFSAMAAQTLKLLIHWYKKREFDWRWLLRDAGMPSAHTATVTALTASLIISEGVTNLTIAVGVLSAIVIRNVIGDKIFAEKQENSINQIIEKIEQSLAGQKVVWSPLIGHTIKEVIVGFILGLVVALSVFEWAYFL